MPRLPIILYVATAVASWPPSDAWAGEPHYPALPHDATPSGIWSDGEGTIWAVDDGVAYELQRGQSTYCAHETGLGGSQRIVGRGDGTAATVVVYNRAGDIAVKDGHFSPVPPVGQPFDALAIAENCDLVAPTSTDLRVYDGADWIAYPYPRDVEAPGSIIDGRRGKLLMLLPGPTILEFDGDTIDDITPPAVGALADRASPRGWYDRAADTLWLAAAANRLISVDYSSDPAVVLEHAIGRTDLATERVLGMGGRALPSDWTGPERQYAVVVASASTLTAFDGAQVYPLKDDAVAPIEDALLDDAEAALYVLAAGNLARIELPPPLDSAAGRAGPWPVPRVSCRDSTIPRAIDEVVTAPAPPDERGRSSGMSGMVNLRLAGGPSLRPLRGGDVETSATLEVAAGLHVAWTPVAKTGFGIRGELGYQHDDHEILGGRRFIAGVGPMWGSPVYATVALVPRLVVGEVGSQYAAGFNDALLGEFLLGGLNVELSHQVMFVDGYADHTVRLMFGCDVFMGLAAIIYGGPLLGALIF